MYTYLCLYCVNNHFNNVEVNKGFKCLDYIIYYKLFIVHKWFFSYHPKITYRQWMPFECIVLVMPLYYWNNKFHINPSYTVTLSRWFIIDTDVFLHRLQRIKQSLFYNSSKHHWTAILTILCATLHQADIWKFQKPHSDAAFIAASRNSSVHA